MRPDTVSTAEPPGIVGDGPRTDLAAVLIVDAEIKVADSSEPDDGPSATDNAPLEETRTLRLTFARCRTLYRQVMGCPHQIGDRSLRPGHLVLEAGASHLSGAWRADVGPVRATAEAAARFAEPSIDGSYRRMHGWRGKVAFRLGGFGSSGGSRGASDTRIRVSRQRRSASGGSSGGSTGRFAGRLQGLLGGEEASWGILRTRREPPVGVVPRDLIACQRTPLGYPASRPIPYPLDMKSIASRKICRAVGSSSFFESSHGAGRVTPLHISNSYDRSGRGRDAGRVNGSREVS